MSQFRIWAICLLLVSSTAFSKSTEDQANIFVNLAKKIVPSVVNIQTTTFVKSGPMNRRRPDDLYRRFFEDFFRQHGGGMGPNDDEGDDSDSDSDQGPPNGQKNGRRAPRAMSLGTGFIIDSSGLILTNNHVVAEADEIKIQFTEDLEEKPTDGVVVGRDPELDLALIRVKSKRTLTPVVFGDSDALEVGEYVIAVGNPFGQGHSVTHGIISAKGRNSPDFALAKYLQTDAPINPGNSGGPLVNLKGEVIGINNAIDQRAQGIGFAIPINSVKSVLPQLKTKGTVARGYIGVVVNELTPDLAPKFGLPKEARNPVVTQVYPGEPADRAGIKPYDLILEIAGKTVKSSGDLIAAVTSVPVDDTVPVKIWRSGKELRLNIKVAQRPGATPTAQKTTQPKKKHKASSVEMGLELEDLTPQISRDLGIKEQEKVSGVVVSTTSYGGPADRAGLVRGDIILEVDKRQIKSVDQFYSIVNSKKSYLLRVRRQDPQGRDNYAIIVLDLKQES